MSVVSLPVSFNHEMLVANAGSGKTFALTTRIIRLLLAGVSIDRIAALTFTRKSAGEFLDELLTRLAEAAIDRKKLAALAKECNNLELSTTDCCELLRHIIDHFGRLGLSTIDSFFSRIARQFPLESGLPEEFTIADSASLASARELALAKSFKIGVEDTKGLKSMIEQCQQISRKRGERNVFNMLLEQVNTLHQRYLETPKDSTWGDAAAIWNKQELPFTSAIEIDAAIDNFTHEVSISNPLLSSEALANLEAGLGAIRELKPGQAWSKDIQKFVDQKLISEPKDNHIRLASKKLGGWVKLTPTLRSSRKILTDTLFADALEQILARAKGLYEFIQLYEGAYAKLVRSAGLISFADITTALAERATDVDQTDSLDWCSQVAYRIDQSFDHWLLDEFQDTSRAQWKILRTFIDEVLMDEDAQRSFFYVGDTKQAIYGWRGGDAELFREIFDYYENIQEGDALTDSWRSSEPVIKMVNSIFGSMDTIADALKLPEATQDRWRKGWNKHEVAPANRMCSGYAALCLASESLEEDVLPQHANVRRIIEEVDPLTRNIECAVLLRQNKDAAELAAYLQSSDIAVTLEGKSNPCTDNPLGSAVLAALRTVAHPSDSLSTAIVRGLPCSSAWGLDDLKNFRKQTLQSIAEYGYTNTIQTWIELAGLNPSNVIINSTSSVAAANDDIGIATSKKPLAEELFLQSRSEAILAVAENFDATSNSKGGIDAFIAAVESAEVIEAEATKAIRVMTIHQAKGLGFEMVIVCGLDRTSHNCIADELVLGPDGRNPQWGMLLPKKDIAEADPVLRQQSDRLNAESRTNELCSAYVALTRAKRALYVICDELAETSKATHFGRHLQLRLEKGWSAGNPSWFEDSQ
ncbi:MAG: UvrD-helicase domain-containing protein [Verrucomicrobiota bacterium]|nr:UvrD-helicase domain-containing protein [Verrucomicrobiota bacterium]